MKKRHDKHLGNLLNQIMNYIVSLKDMLVRELANK